jgi:hypothetical protein
MSRFVGDSTLIPQETTKSPEVLPSRRCFRSRTFGGSALVFLVEMRPVKAEESKPVYDVVGQREIL